MKTTRKHPAATRHFGTRTLCLLMSLVMALSLVQVSVFATTAPAQVMSGNYVLNTDGTISEDGSGNAVTAATARTQGDYTLTKTAAANSSRGENWFNVTVQVGTTQTITTNDAAVVLVIDTSGSMAYCAECGGEKSHSSTCKYYNKNKHNNDVTLEQSRMAATITEAKAFVQNLKDSNSGGKVYVSVVRFSGFSQSDASLVRNWTDVSTDAGAAAVKNSINSTNLFARGGTNMEAGLMMARNLLNVTAASIGGGSVNISALANKYTVLLTDGQPTARCNTDHTGLGAISDYNEDGDGMATSTAEYEETVSMAAQVKTLSKLYTICYGTSGDPLTATTTIGNYLRDSIATAATPGVTYAFNTDNLTALHSAFAAIANSASSGSTGGGTQVIDPMGAEVVLDQDSVSVTGGTAAKTATALIWTLDPATASTSTTGGVTTYTYTMTYSVRLATEKQGFAQGTYYPTNGYTYLSVPQTSGTPEQLAFTVPAVMGYTGSLGFTKTDMAGTALRGAAFTLASTTEGISWSQNVQSDANGAVSFTNIPSGCAFTLRENSAPTGYDKDNTVYTLGVAYGQLSWTGSSPLNTNNAFPNTATQQYTTLAVSKTWIAPAGAALPASIEVTLQRDGNDYGVITLSKTAASWQTNPAPTDAHVTVTKGAGDWTCAVTVPANKGGLLSSTYSYTIKETNVDTANWDSSTSGLAITNSYKGTTSVRVTKDWVSGIAAWPAAGITVKLLNDGNDTGKTLTLTKDNPTGTFTGLPTVVNGKVAVYTVAEVVNDASGAAMFQQVGITGSAAEGYTITNAVNQEDVTIAGSKTWNDNSNAYGTRPASVTVGLYNGDTLEATKTVTADASGNWSYSFSEDSLGNNLPKYEFTHDNGKITGVSVISYTVREMNGNAALADGAVAAGGYKVTYNDSTHGIVNTLTGTVDVSVSKNWIDVAGASHTGKNVTVQLMQNGAACGDAKTVAGDGTATSWNALPKYDANGVAYSYTVGSENVSGEPTGYTLRSVTANADKTAYTVTNQLTDPRNASISGTKSWAEPGGTGHPTATVGLFKRAAGCSEDWVNTEKTTEVGAGNTYSFTGLPVYEERTTGGTPEMAALEYRIFEMDGTNPVADGGLIGAYAVSYGTVTQSSSTFTQNLTNTITGTTSVTVNKTWVDGVNRANRNATFTLSRSADGSPDTAFSATATQSNLSAGGSYTWSGLAKYDASGRLYTYTVGETTNGYSPEISANQSTNGAFVYNITNTLNQAYTSISVTKNWVDGGNTANRPATITLNLYRNDTLCASQTVATVTNGNTQTYTFGTDDNGSATLPLYSDDRTVQYTYTIGEAAVTGKTNAYAAPAYDQGTHVITNALAQQTVDVGVAKVWLDPTGTEHPDVTFTVSGAVNGEAAIVNKTALAPVTATVGFSGTAGTVAPTTGTRTSTNWTYTFQGLPKYDDNGFEIVYTVSEGTLAGYTSTKSKGYNTFTNTIAQAPTTFTVTKEFANMSGDGVNSAAPTAPTAVYIQLMAGSVKVGKPVSLPISSNTGSYTFSDLPTYDANGQRIQYTAVEVVPTDGDYRVLANGDTVGYGGNNYTVRYGQPGPSDGGSIQTITNTYQLPSTFYYKLTRNYAQYRNGVQVAAASVSTWVPKAASGTYTEDPAAYTTYTYPAAGGEGEKTVTHSFVAAGSNTSVDVVNPNDGSYGIVLNYVETLNSGAVVRHVYRTHDTYTGATTVDETVEMTSAYSSTDTSVGTWTINKETGEASFVPAIVNRNGYKFLAEASQEEGGAVPVGATVTFTLYYERTTDSTPVGPYIPPEKPIPDPDVPLEPTPVTPVEPGTDITDPDVPQAGAAEQATGDELYLWIALATASGMSLAWLAISGKKRRDENNK